MGKRVLFAITVMLFVCLPLFAIDLRIGPNIIMTPSNPAPGTNMEFKCRLISYGGDSKNVQVFVQMGGTTIYNHLYPVLYDGNQKIISVNWTATQGTHTVKFHIASVDPTTPDSTTGNNVAMKTFTVIPAITVGKKLGTVTKPGPMTGATTYTPTPNFQLDPCFANRNGTTDLTVDNFHVTKVGDTQWKFTFQIKNSGPRCIKTLVYEVENMGHMVKQQRLGNLTNAGWLLQGSNDVYLVEKTVSADTSPPFWTENGHTYTMFTVTVDTYSDNAETNESNNSTTDNLQLQ
ncbi:MAG: hypothetical protein JW737_03770 [Acidobacteria bacterium]|nr:hypothetical protein [Acidobacteriota bacterium]